MIYITGDTHGTLDYSKLKAERFKEGQKLTKEDYLLIVGDFGGVFGDNLILHDGRLKEDNRDRRLLDWYEKQPYTTLFIDGNHENFRSLYRYPELDWNGGRVHKLRESVYHLCRGYVFNIQGKTFFTLGGGYSIDKQSRIAFIDWWEEELPTNEELDRSLDNLSKVNNKVDYIITHAAPLGIMERLQVEGVFHTLYKEERNLNNFLEYLNEIIDYKQWYFGHLHLDREFKGNKVCLYNKILRLE